MDGVTALLARILNVSVPLDPAWGYAPWTPHLTLVGGALVMTVYSYLIL